LKIIELSENRGEVAKQELSKQASSNVSELFKIQEEKGVGE